jgi:hypothetical protein
MGYQCPRGRSGERKYESYTEKPRCADLRKRRNE